MEWNKLVEDETIDLAANSEAEDAVNDPKNQATLNA